MATLKIKDWEAGKYSREIQLSELEARQMEVELIEKFDKTKIPPGTFLIEASIQVRFHVEGTAEEIAKNYEMWSRVYTTHPVIVSKEVELTSKELKTVEVKSTLFKEEK